MLSKPWVREKSGPVENELTRPAATALLTCKIEKSEKINSRRKLDPGHLVV